MEQTRGGTALRPRIKVSAKVKTFVLDTNVLLHDPQSIFKFQENNLAISIKHNRVSMMAGQEMEKFVSTDVSKISKHAMIVLHPEKLSSQPVARPFSLIY